MILSKRFSLISLAALLAIVAGLGTGQFRRATAQQSGNIIADSGFRPEKDGFGFPNYTNSKRPQNMTPAEMHRMFGDKVCEPGTESQPDCTLVPPATQWMDTIDNVMGNGHCGGMAILSELFYTQKANLGDFGAQG